MSCIASLVGGCALINKVEEVFIPDENTVEMKETKKKTISITCSQGKIKDHTEKGWKVIGTEEKEVPCKWKTKKAKRNCNPKKDKGCLITVPDEYGKEIIYFLEKESLIDKRK